MKLRSPKIKTYLLIFIVVDKDECTGKPCESVLNSKCVDTVGSYFCKCKDGFSRLISSGPCRGNIIVTYL